MNPLVWFVVAHLIGDFLLQTEYEAMNKAQGRFLNGALLSHSAKYTLCFAPVCWVFQVPLFWLGAILGTHLVLDRRWPIIAWRRHVKRDSEEGIKQTFWLTVIIDQIFHLFVLVLISSLR